MSEGPRFHNPCPRCVFLKRIDGVYGPVNDAYWCPTHRDHTGVRDNLVRICDGVSGSNSLKIEHMRSLLFLYSRETEHRNMYLFYQEALLEAVRRTLVCKSHAIRCVYSEGRS